MSSYWQQLEIQFRNSSCTTKGVSFESIALHYLRHDRRQQFTDVWTNRTVPQSLLDRLGLRRTDIGVDLYARRANGKLVAVQAKFRSNCRVTWDEFRESLWALAKFDGGLLYFTNATQLPSKLPKNIKNVSAILRHDLTQAPLWMLTPSTAVSAVKLAKPRPHQERAVTRAEACFASASRGKYIAATGAGKTLTTMWIAQALAAQRVMLFVPSLALAKQSLSRWYEQWRGQLSSMVVCSLRDEDVRDLRKEELPIPVTTDPGEVREFWDARLAPGETRLIVATYASARSLLKVSHEASLLIADEAHRIAGPSGKRAQVVLHKVPAHRRLFCTATPRIIDPVVRGRAMERGHLVASMDDPEDFGTVIDEFNFSEAVAAGVLAPSQIMVPVITDAMISRMVHNRDLVLEEFDAEQLAVAVAIVNGLRARQFRRVFSFHRTKATARRVADAVRAIDPQLYTRTITGDVPVSERESILDELNSTQRAVVTSARALGEGVDAPSVDAVVFGDPKASIIDIVQCTGRALRIDPKNKAKIARVIIPVFIEDGESAEQAKERSQWLTVWRTVRALQNGNRTLQDFIRELVLERGRRPDPRDPLVIIPPEAGDLVLPEGLTLERFIDSVRLEVVKPAVDFLPFEDAREFARKLRFTTVVQWQAYAASESRPAHIPAGPDRAYKGQGWNTWGDWLGTGRLANQLRQFRPFEDARKYARQLHLKFSRDWRGLGGKGELMEDLPGNPDRAYSDAGWAGWGDFLGTHHRRGGWRRFNEAREFARSLGLENGDAWRAFCRSNEKPHDIPAQPHQVYAKEWQGMGNWLGTGRLSNVGRTYRSFAAARAYVRQLKLRNQGEWRAALRHGRVPADIPGAPNKVYAEAGWLGYGDWLGTGNLANRDKIFRSFGKARAFARSLGLGSVEEWREFAKTGRLPVDIPRHPYSVYGSDKRWRGMGDWLGTGVVSSRDKNFRPFESARRYARTLGLESSTEWHQYASSGRRPSDIPSAPYSNYREQGWAGWPDWLGFDPNKSRRKHWRPFPAARRFARSLDLKSAKDWRAYASRRPKDVPANPDQVYRDVGWSGWRDWLGTKNGRH